jgi:hypothetical protein
VGRSESPDPHPGGAAERRFVGVLFVAYSYSAFAAGRQSKAISAISGPGLIFPACKGSPAAPPSTPPVAMWRRPVPPAIGNRLGQGRQGQNGAPRSATYRTETRNRGTRSRVITYASASLPVEVRDSLCMYQERTWIAVCVVRIVAHARVSTFAASRSWLVPCRQRKAYRIAGHDISSPADGARTCPRRRRRGLLVALLRRRRTGGVSMSPRRRYRPGA